MYLFVLWKKCKNNEDNGVFYFVVDAYEPPNCQNIPAPNVGTAPSVNNSSSNPDTSNSSSSSGSNPTIPNTTSASTAASTNVSSNEALPSNSSGCSSSSANCHHSPYDLRKKSPSTCNSNNNNNHNNSENWLGCIAGSSSSSSSSLAAASSSGQQSSSHNHHHYSLANNNNNSNNVNYDYLPARKRPRRTYSSNDASATTMSAAHYLQYEMPDEVLLTIFSYLLEQDLCRVSLVCKRFQVIANDCGLWKRLYQNVYEYDMPLFNPEHSIMNFVKVEDCDYSNPWKESFRQLYHGIHVRPGYQDKKFQGRNISYFNTVQSALDYADERNAANNLNGNAQMNGANSNASNSNLSIPPASPNILLSDENSSVHDLPSTLIFLHTGIYRGEFLVIDSDIILIGAASGNVAESVVLGIYYNYLFFIKLLSLCFLVHNYQIDIFLERESESTVMFVEGAKNAYIGHMTLKFSPDITSTVPHHKHYCLEISENCSPTIDHCIIRSTSVGEYLFFFTFKYKSTNKRYCKNRIIIFLYMSNSKKSLVLITSFIKF